MCFSNPWISLSRFSSDPNGGYKCSLLENPINEITLVDDKPLTLDDTVAPGGESEFVQISPQRIRLKLRLGEKTKIKFKVANAKKYPVDLYYLMDLSNSMSDDRETVVSREDHIFYSSFYTNMQYCCHIRLLL